MFYTEELTMTEVVVRETESGGNNVIVIPLTPATAAPSVVETAADAINDTVTGTVDVSAKQEEHLIDINDDVTVKREDGGSSIFDTASTLNNDVNESHSLQSDNEPKNSLPPSRKDHREQDTTQVTGRRILGSRSPVCVTRSYRKVAKSSNNKSDEFSARLDARKVQKQRRCKSQTKMQTDIVTENKGREVKGKSDVKKVKESVRGEEVRRNERTHQCDKCEFASKHAQQLNIHKLARHSDSSTKRFECDQCDYTTTLKSYMTRHKQKHSSNVLMCDECSYTTKISDKLRSHRKRKHGGAKTNMYKCKYCEFRTDNKMYIGNHERIHDKEKWLKCDHCDYSTAFKGNLLEHAATVHGAGKHFICDKCGVKTTKKTVLQSHKCVENRKHLECDVCGFKTRLRGSLQQHKLRRHGEGCDTLWLCTECGYSTPVKETFQYHLRTQHHTQPHRLLACDKCSYTSYSSGHMKAHQYTHTGVASKPYTCPSGCHFRAISQRDLDTHVRTVHGTGEGKRYHCDNCRYHANNVRHFLAHSCGVTTSGDIALKTEPEDE